MTLVRIPETVIEGKRLGRHMDARTNAARAVGGPPQMAAKVESVTHEAYGLPLNQGKLGSCTANALCGALNTVPHYQAQKSPKPKTLNEVNAVHLYSTETALEGQPYPPNDPGGTGQYACEAAINLGWCSDFQVAATLDEALRALVLRPVIVGVNWYTSFDTPSSAGLVEIADGATVRGGHEIVATAIDAKGGLVWLWNSWGTSYGIGGRFCMTFATLGTLLSQGGDCTVPRTAPNWVAP